MRPINFFARSGAVFTVTSRHWVRFAAIVYVNGMSELNENLRYVQLMTLFLIVAIQQS